MKKIVLPTIHSFPLKQSIVISSAVGLIRNIEGLMFPNKLITEEKILIENEIVSVLGELEEPITIIDTTPLTDSEKSQLAIDFKFQKIERLVISKNDGSWVLLPNYRDHLCVFSLSYGQHLKDMYKNISNLLTFLDTKIYFSYDPEIGFASSDTRYAGNGLKFSVLLNLTALDLQSKIKELQKTCEDTGYLLKSYVPNTSLFLLKNKNSFGIKELEHINHMIQLLNQIQDKENSAKKELLSDEENKELLTSQVSQLSQQDALSYNEVVTLISLVDFLDKKIYNIQDRQLWLEQLFLLKDHIFAEIQDIDQVRAQILQSVFAQLVIFK